MEDQTSGCMKTPGERPFGRAVRWPLALMAGSLALAAGGCAARAAQEDKMPFDCTAEGAEHLTPGSSGEAACRRFASSLESTQSQLAGYSETPQDIEIFLRFTRTGMARAEVRRKGDSELLFDAVIAMSDRPLDAAVIDRLADRVAREFQVRYD